MKCAGMEKTIKRRWEKLCYHPVSIQLGGPTGKTPPHLQTDGRRERTVMLSGQDYGKEKRRTGNGEEGKGNQGEPGEARLLPLASPGIVEMMMEKGQGKKGETQKNRRKENRTNASEKVRIPGVWRKVRD